MADLNKTKPDGDDGQANRESQQGGIRGPNQRKPPPQKLMSRGLLGWVLLAGLAVMLLLMMNSVQHQAHMLDQWQFLNYAKDKAFKHDGENVITVKDDRVVGELKIDTPGVPTEWGPPPWRVSTKISPETKADFVVRLRDEHGLPVQEDSGGSILVQLLIHWGPLILIAFLIYFFIFRSIRNAGNGPGMLGSFGRSRHRVTNKEHSNVRLSDVAGVEEVKEEVGEIIEFLKNPKKFQRLGGRVPRGVLLIGAPGCGKTLLARAVAGEAEVPFFSISGSDFVEMFVGVGASRVRDLFKQAKDSSPCIIFLDEIDAVGRRRGAGFSSGGHDEREQTLNAILVEMDGFETNDQVIVIAATNRGDVLDPALIRPGRFDRQIQVPLPDIQGRVDILKVHSQRVKMGPEVELERLARGTPMFSGADLAAIINEAAIAATLQNKNFVEQDDLEEARDKVKWGRARRSQKIDEEEKKVIAYHEAGHAIVTYFEPDAEPLHKVTIIPRGPSMGVTIMLPEKDRHILTRKQLLAQLRVTFGGRISEQMFCGDSSSGAAQDIRQATAIVRAMVTEYGMSDKLGFLLYDHTEETNNPWDQMQQAFSDETAKIIDQEVRDLINQNYAAVSTLLADHREELERVADALLRYETLLADEVDRLIKGLPLEKQTVGDLLRVEQDKHVAVSVKGDQDQDSTLEEDAPGAIPSPA